MWRKIKIIYLFRMHGFEHRVDVICDRTRADRLVILDPIFSAHLENHSLKILSSLTNIISMRFT